MIQQRKMSGLAIASLVFGVIAMPMCIIPIIGLFVAPIIIALAIIFGIMARNRIKRNSDLKGKALALVGIILGCLCVFFDIVIVPFIIVPRFK